VIDELLQGVGREPSIQDYSISTLGNLGHFATPAVIAKLVSKLGDRDSDVVRWSIEALGELYFLATPEVVNALIISIKSDPVSSVRRAAAYALGRFNASEIPEIIDALSMGMRDQAEDVRDTAAMSLVSHCLQNVSRAVSRLWSLADDHNVEIKRSAVKGLGRLFFKASQLKVNDPSKNTHTLWLAHDDLEVRQNLPTFATPETVTVLAKMTHDDDLILSSTAIQILGTLGSLKICEAVERLLALTNDPNPLIGDMALKAIGNLEACVSSVVVETLINATRHLNADVKKSSISTLGRLPLHATCDVVLALFSALVRDTPDVGGAAGYVISKLGSHATPRIMTSLLAQLKNETAVVRAFAAIAIKTFIPEMAVEIISALLATMDDEYNEVKVAGIIALNNLLSGLDPQLISGMSDRVINRLLVNIRDQDSDVRDESIITLGHLGVYAKSRIGQQLLQALNHEDEDTRKNVVYALGELALVNNAHQSEIIQRLTIQLKDESTLVKMAIINVLQKLNAFSSTRVIQEIATIASRDEEIAMFALARVSDVIGTAFLFQFLQKGCNQAIRQIALNLFVDQFFKQNKALIYNRANQSLCYWEHGNLVHYTASPQELAWLIQEMKKIWNKQTYSSDTHWKIPRDLRLAAQQEQNKEEHAKKLFSQQHLARKDSELKNAFTFFGPVQVASQCETRFSRKTPQASESGLFWGNFSHCP